MGRGGEKEGEKERVRRLRNKKNISLENTAREMKREEREKAVGVCMCFVNQAMQLLSLQNWSNTRLFVSSNFSSMST